MFRSFLIYWLISVARLSHFLHKKYRHSRKKLFISLWITRECYHKTKVRFTYYVILWSSPFSFGINGRWWTMPIYLSCIQAFVSLLGIVTNSLLISFDGKIRKWGRREIRIGIASKSSNLLMKQPELATLHASHRICNR